MIYLSSVQSIRTALCSAIHSYEPPPETKAAAIISIVTSIAVVSFFIRVLTMASRNHQPHIAVAAAEQSTSSADEPSTKMTPAMSAALENLRSSLLCGLCNKVMKDAATLGCAHSFCYNCISLYTQNRWTCPFPSCNISVTSMKGNSDSYIKKNPQINDVIIALQRIEENVIMAPDRWWETGDKSHNNNTRNDNCDLEEEEVVDFAAMQNNDIDCSNDSSTTKAYEPENFCTNEMVIDQSIFPSDQSENGININRCDSTLPRFSGVSSIAWQHSQMTDDSKKSPEPTVPIDNDDPQTATASQLDRVLMIDSVQTYPTDTNAASTAGIEVKRAENERLPSPEKKMPPEQSEKKRKKDCSGNLDELKHAPKSRRTQRVSFQPQPKVMLLNPSLALSNSESRLIRKCIKDDMITMLRMRRDIEGDDVIDASFDFDNKDGREYFLKQLTASKHEHSLPSSTYAISTEKEYAFDEGVVVPRTFRWYLAVALGLPIVDISFLESHSKKKRLGVMNHQRYPFPKIDKKSKTKEEKATHVIGASNHNWFAPQNATSAAVERHLRWANGDDMSSSSERLPPGIDLLKNFRVILLGDFDQASVSKRVAKKRAKVKESSSEGYCTRGNITILLQLCQARVYDITSLATPKQIKKGLSQAQLGNIVNETSMDLEGSTALKDDLQSYFGSKSKSEGGFLVMVKDKSDTKLGAEFVTQFTSFASDIVQNGVVNVVSCDWLFDCIGDFQVHTV